MILFERDLKKFAEKVNSYNLHINQNQFDALVSFCYNIGSLRGLAEKIKNGTISNQDFTAYSYAKGKFLQGLKNRREDEYKLYSKDI